MIEVGNSFPTADEATEAVHPFAKEKNKSQGKEQEQWHRQQ